MSEMWENKTTSTNRTNQTGHTDTGSGYSGTRFQFPATDSSYTGFDIFQMTVLTTTLVLSSIGNGFVVWTSSKNVLQRQYARLHILLVSLALSDILQGPFQVMPQLVTTILKTWSLGDTICRIHALTRSMLANVSCSTLAIITLERFLNVESIDGNAHLAIYTCAIAFVWVLQGALAIPMGVWNVVATYGPQTSCRIPFSKLPDTLDYTVAVRVVAFFCPLGVLWIGNLGVIYKLRRMDRKILPLAAGVAMNPVRKRRSRKVTLTCLMLAIVFTVNLTPFQVALLVVQTATERSVAQAAIDSMSYLWLLTVVNGFLNPMIYGFFLRNLKQRMVHICKNCLCCRSTASGHLGIPKGSPKLFSSSNSGVSNIQPRQTGTGLTFDTSKSHDSSPLAGKPKLAESTNGGSTLHVPSPKVAGLHGRGENRRQSLNYTTPASKVVYQNEYTKGLHSSDGTTS